MQFIRKLNLYWKNLKFKDISKEYLGPREAGSLKLKSNNALANFKWNTVLGF